MSLTLQWDEHQQWCDTDDGGQSDVEPVVHEVRDDDGFERSDPQVMEEYNTNVESVDVIGQQIDCLADRRLAQRGPRQFQRFAIDERATGDADLHPHV